MAVTSLVVSVLCKEGLLGLSQRRSACSWSCICNHYTWLQQSRYYHVPCFQPARYRTIFVLACMFRHACTSVCRSCKDWLSACALQLRPNPFQAYAACSTSCWPPSNQAVAATARYKYQLSSRYHKLHSSRENCEHSEHVTPWCISGSPRV